MSAVFAMMSTTLDACKDGAVVALHGPSGVLVPRMTIARSFLRRLKGRLGTPDFPAGEGLLIVPCKEIHMLGMKYAIDVVFLDRELKVVGMRPELPVGTLRLALNEAYCTLELPAGTLDGSWKDGMQVRLG